LPERRSVHCDGTKTRGCHTVRKLKKGGRVMMLSSLRGGGGPRERNGMSAPTRKGMNRKELTNVT